MDITTVTPTLLLLLYYLYYYYWYNTSTTLILNSTYFGTFNTNNPTPTTTTSINTSIINTIITNTTLLPKLSLKLLQFTILCLLMIHDYNKYLQQLLLPISTNNTLTTTAINNNTVNHTITYRTVDITLIPPFLLSLIANY